MVLKKNSNMYFGGRNRKRPERVTVYLMNVIGSDIYKIGYTTNPIESRRSRIKSEVGSVKIIATTYCDFRHESILHDHFRPQICSYGIYANNKEYFKLSKSDICFVLDYFKKVECPPLVMDCKHPKWKEFLRAIHFQVNRTPARICNHTYLHTKDILRRYKQVDIAKSVELFQQLGVVCDCEILKIESHSNTAIFK